MNISFGSNSMMGLANPKVRRRKFGIGSLLFLVLFGVVFTAAGIWAIKDSKIDPSWVKVSGQVVSSTSNFNSGNNGSGSTTYTPVVKYEVNNQSYTVTSSSGSSSYPQIGSQREVAYNPTQPDQAKVVQSSSTFAFLYMFPVIGILCLIGAPVAFVKSLKRSKDINQLTHSGQKLQGILSDIQTTYGGSNRGANYKIVVSATDSGGTVQTYVSDTIAGIGGLAMADFRNTPIPIDVYVNSSNPSDYYVDVSDIPGLTPQRIGELLSSVAGRTLSQTFAQSGQPNPPVPPVQVATQPGVPAYPPATPAAQVSPPNEPPSNPPSNPLQ